ncbi:signal transduction histidine kinase/transcriptional regulator with GAF, ATPase, and Fis domain [Deinococcus metalli]|uniref:histidine kinase n=1 Tax=Deinococcus metalli TaxID=1141878 RepID=A0A7W8NRQ8_9DEIO|nr:ATP-binding protein [Deinococcus metalli]MBB5376387.1 signal transduction histidine kinase/transcriptional regulator with GAF, ATPase, and Fis domain [Deinococcus metalli]GHF44434.1 hypothetical protein GCM10017781_21170 [Deinococcus metalli]
MSRPPPPALSEHLHDVIERLAAARTPQDAVETILHAAVDTLGASGGAVFRVAGDALSVMAMRGAVRPEAWHAPTLHGSAPVNDALRDRQARYYGPGGDVLAASLDLAGATGAVLPVTSPDGPQGALVVAFDAGRVLSGEDRRLLRTLAVQGAVALRDARAAQQLEAEVRTRTAELEARNAALDEERAALDAFVVYKESIGTESDVLRLARQAVDVVRASLEDVSVGYYERDGQVWRARVWSEDVPPAVAEQIRAGVPLDAPHFAEAARTMAPVFVDDWTAQADGLSSDVPFGTAAFIPLVIHDEARSLFAVGSRGAHVWSERERAIVRAVARGLRLTLERSEQQRQLEVERAALAAFARLTEMSAETTDVHALARQATDVLRGTLGDVSVTFSELEAGRWKARVWSEDHSPEVVAVIEEGVPADAPHHAEAVRSGAVLFVPGSGAERPGMTPTQASGAAALFPYVVAGAPQGLLTMGTHQAADWTDRERQVFRAVGRSLGVALERAALSHHLTAQNEELAARTRALEGFAELTRGLSLRSDPYALVKRAQEVVMSLLPPGYAVYYEPERPVWRLRAQTGSLRNDELQRLVDAGLPYDDVRNVLIPFETGQPFYQDLYERDIDNLAEYVEHLGASATLPVLVEGQPRGVFAVVLFDEVRQWTRADKAVMETVVRSLGLAIEGSQGLLHLHRAMDELERSNRELEQFAYVASHDLQEPLRSVTSFVDLLLRRLPDDDERAATYAQYIRDGTTRMSQLIRDVLAFSRVSAQGRAPRPVDVQRVAAQVLHDLADQIQRVGAAVTVGELPGVTADETQVRQLIQNLLGNALKFVPPERAPEVQVRGVADGAWVRFSVADNGIGIDPAYHEKVFAIFQRLNPREAYEGTGIGLSIARRIVERHGGTIGITSTPGQGTTITFTLPARP